MGLNSEPIPENEALLRLIDQGIAALEDDEEPAIEISEEELLKRQKK